MNESQIRSVHAWLETGVVWLHKTQVWVDLGVRTYKQDMSYWKEIGEAREGTDESLKESNRYVYNTTKM